MRSYLRVCGSSDSRSTSWVYPSCLRNSANYCGAYSMTSMSSWITILVSTRSFFFGYSSLSLFMGIYFSSFCYFAFWGITRLISNLCTALNLRGFSCSDSSSSSLSFYFLFFCVKISLITSVTREPIRNFWTLVSDGLMGISTNGLPTILLNAAPTIFRKLGSKIVMRLMKIPINTLLMLKLVIQCYRVLMCSSSRGSISSVGLLPSNVTRYKT